MTNGAFSPRVGSRSRTWMRLLALIAVLTLGGFAAHADLRWRSMRRWETEARAAGLVAEIHSECLFKPLDKFPICRRCLAVHEPRVSILSEDDLFTLFGLKHRCPPGLKIRCSARRIRLVMAILARKLLDAEVHVNDDDGCGVIPLSQQRPPFLSE